MLDQPDTKTGFIRSEKYNNWFATDMSIYHCEFARELYSDQLFSQLSIEFPASLQNAVTKRRAEFLAGRYCAKKSLQAFAIDINSLAIGKHRNPLWPEPMVGSISHCGNQAVAISGPRTAVRGLGIDIEDQISDETLAKIQSQILNDQEIALISDNIAEKSLLFTLAFSFKESFFKAAYPTVEKYFDFDAVSLVSIEWETRKILLRINNPLHQSLGAGTIVEGNFQILPEKKVVTLVMLKNP